jgi:P pilus assembly chaperone PapD
MRKGFARRRVRWIALAFGVVATLLPKAAAAQISVDELEVFLRPGRGAASTGSLRVTNDTDKPVQAFVEIQDWDRDDRGANRFFPSGSVAQSCKDRVKVFPMTLRLEPKRSETMRVSFEGDSTANCWSIVFIQANEPRPELKKSAITYIIRTGVKVYVEPANAKRDGAIEDVRVGMRRQLPASGGKDSIDVREVQVTFHNMGDAHLRTHGSIELRKSDNSVAGKLEIQEFPSVPGSIRKISLPLPKDLAPGAYVALALLDYGGQEIAAGQAEFEVK